MLVQAHMLASINPPTGCSAPRGGSGVQPLKRECRHKSSRRKRLCARKSRSAARLSGTISPTALRHSLGAQVDQVTDAGENRIDAVLRAQPASPATR